MCKLNAPAQKCHTSPLLTSNWPEWITRPGSTIPLRSRDAWDKYLMDRMNDHTVFISPTRMYNLGEQEPRVFCYCCCYYYSSLLYPRGLELDRPQNRCSRNTSWMNDNIPFINPSCIPKGEISRLAWVLYLKLFFHPLLRAFWGRVKIFFFHIQSRIYHQEFSC